MTTIHDDHNSRKVVLIGSLSGVLAGFRLRTRGVTLLLVTVASVSWTIERFLAQSVSYAIDGDEITNPYYRSRAWHAWSIDSSHELQSPIHSKLASIADRIFPDDSRVFSYSAKQGRLAGWWDDVYVSQDNFHSRIHTSWQDDDGNQVQLAGQFPILKRGYYQFQVRGNQLFSPATAELKRLGANFTSQSTSHMGHDIANHPLQMLVLEREFYFADILRSAPAHVSFREVSLGPSVDEYQALVPSFFNSIGSSGSETWALTKMIIAGAHLQADLKKEIKRHGIYPATLLYLWKAALPFDAPYVSDMRHRVAYFSDGADRLQKGKLQADVDTLSHRYDDGLHMRNMARLASELEAAPPVAVLGNFRAEGGKLVYGLRTAALVVQDEADVVVHVSTRDSYDIQQHPIKVRLELLCGNPQTKIVETSSGEFKITVPYDKRLPKGRTSILAIANNGYTDGNPAIVNIYNRTGNANQRPVFKLQDRHTVAPGHRIQAEIQVHDPEGFPVTLTKRSEDLGELTGHTFSWACPPEIPVGDRVVHLIASDNTSGSSFRSVQLPIAVRTVVAQMEADRLEGEAPFAVQFSAQSSADVHGGQLAYHWDFGDGQTSTEVAPQHRFEQPGYYRVGLIVESSSSSDTIEKIIHARHSWPLEFANGWNQITVRPWNWLEQGTGIRAEVSGYQGTHAMHVIASQKSDETLAIQYARPVQPPCYFKIGFYRGNKTPGDGIELFGAVFGRGAVDSEGSSLKFAEDLSFTHRLPSSDRVDSQFLMNFPRNPSGPAELKLYVTKDPTESSKYRYSGYLTCEGKEKFFSFDGCELTQERIAILSGGVGAQFITEFKIWGPGE